MKTEIDQLELRCHGLVGTLYRPLTSNPSPAVLCLGGSEGSAPTITARALAKEGFATLALAYCRAPGLPASIRRIPLEYCFSAMTWLQEQELIRTDYLAIRGFSRGAELALILGTLAPEIKAILAYSPSCCAHNWQDNQATLQDSDPSWTLGGEALRGRYLDRGYCPLHGGSGDLIPIEKLYGCLCLVSGDDDRMWQSTQSCRHLMEKLRRRSSFSEHLHLAYPNAGHSIGYPPPFLFSLAWGGTIEGNRFAVNDSWLRSIIFLRRTAGLD